MKIQIAIIDFGSQYTHLIARRVRQLGVLAKIYPPTIQVKDLKGVKGLILSGGPQSVHNQTAIKYNSKIFDLGVPILGLCYGHQLIAKQFGGTVQSGKVKEYGFASLKKVGKNILFSGLNLKERVWMSHGDTVKKLPKDFSAIGKTSDCPVAAMANEKQNIYGLQFHPEVTHTQNGLIVLKNFVFKICKAKKDWSMDKYWQQIVKDVKKAVGKRNVFLLVSGGVDSTVCFAVLEKILGKKRVFGLHIDNGFMRLNETKKVQNALSRAGFDDLEVIDASELFLTKEKGVVDREKKREIIGRVFLQVKDKVMEKQRMSPKNWVLGQGTIYPDTIETGATKHADKIKTHHNRVAEILKLMKLGALVEPISELYKDEVRQIGKKLNLPKALLDRHPFPGPGLAIRTLCSNNKGEASLPRHKQVVVNKKLQKIVGPKLQAAVLPVKSVGVQGDNRTYRHPAIIAGNVSWQKLHDLSVEITNKLSEINRVVYLVSPKQINFNQLKIKPSYLIKDRLDLLRQADDIVTKQIRKAKLYKKIWQFPVILAPLSLNRGEAVILRPVESREAMTVNFYPMEKKILNSIAKNISTLPGVDLVLYDVTNKPPGTIEWE